MFNPAPFPKPNTWQLEYIVPDTDNRLSVILSEERNRCCYISYHCDGKHVRGSTMPVRKASDAYRLIREYQTDWQTKLRMTTCVRPEELLVKPKEMA